MRKIFLLLTLFTVSLGLMFPASPTAAKLTSFSQTELTSRIELSRVRLKRENNLPTTDRDTLQRAKLIETEPFDSHEAGASQQLAPMICRAGTQAPHVPDTKTAKLFSEAIDRNITLGTAVRRSHTRKCVGELFSSRCYPDALIDGLRSAANWWREKSSPPVVACKKICRSLRAWYQQEGCHTEGLSAKAVSNLCLRTCKATNLSE